MSFLLPLPDVIGWEAAIITCFYSVARRTRCSFWWKSHIKRKTQYATMPQSETKNILMIKDLMEEVSGREGSHRLLENRGTRPSTHIHKHIHTHTCTEGKCHSLREQSNDILSSVQFYFSTKTTQMILSVIMHLKKQMKIAILAQS